MHLHRDRGFTHPLSSEVTPPDAYAQRRQWLKLLAAGAAGSALATWAARDARASTAAPGKLAPLPGERSTVPGAVTMERPTPYGDVSTYNNFYEFG
ncbi:MAG: protein-methionine-sulfoxide reductase catalytic subunit MsrP, partial [Rubrivivax sp.]